MNASASHRGPLCRQAMAFVLAGGRGSRLEELTDRRAKPAVFFGGHARIIDFALSNAVNSGIRRIGVATQYKAHSLIKHVQYGWTFFRPERNESLDILPASQRVSEANWYLGTADAVFQNIDIIRSYGPKYLVILAGDHIYKQDYGAMLDEHVRTGADVTVACAETPLAEATAFGVMHVDAQDRIVDFVEKPFDPPAMPGRPDTALASMGVYVFDTEFLFARLAADAADPASSHDFGRDIIPTLVREGRAFAHPLSRSAVHAEAEAAPYWRDVGTLDAYYDANLDLTRARPRLDLYDRDWPLWTYSEMTAPARFVDHEDGQRGEAVGSLVAGDCVVSGARVDGSLLSTGVQVDPHAALADAVILPRVRIGGHARLKKVVVDRGVHIPPGLVVGEDPGVDAQRFRRTSNGVCLITQPMIDALNA